MQIETPPSLLTWERAAPWLSALAAAAYAILIPLVFIHHEPWGDEYQSWLRAQNLLSWRDFLVIPGGEGHPPLWYWLLHALGHVTGFQHARYLMLAIDAAVCGLLAALTWRNPFRFALVLFSAPVLFWWTIPFRSYALVLAFVLAAILAYRQQKLKTSGLCLALACATHFYAVFFIPLFVGEEFLSKRSATILKTLVVPAGLAVASVVLSSQGNAAIGPTYGHFLFLRHMATAFVPYAVALADLRPDIQLKAWGLVDLTAVFAIFTLFKCHARAILTYGVLACFLTFLTLIYGHNFHHIFFATAIVAVAALLADKQADDWALAALLCMNIAFGMETAKRDLYGPFSNAHATYMEIQASPYAGWQILALDDFVFAPAAIEAGITYDSLPMATKTDGLIDWTRRKATIDQYRRGYEAAGSPKRFLLAATAQESWKPTHYRMLSAPDICQKLGWTCTRVLGTSGAYKENLDVYAVSVP